MALPIISMSNAGMVVAGCNWAGFWMSNTNQGAYNPSLALDSSGNPVVSWYESDGTSTTSMSNAGMVVVGCNWVHFLDVNTNQNAYNPSLALDSSGNPVVSWEEYDGTSYNIYVKRWNGS